MFTVGALDATRFASKHAAMYDSYSALLRHLAESCRLVQFAGLLVVGPFGGYCLVARPHVLLSVTLSQTRLVC